MTETGPLAVVTGGATGLGAAIVRRLAADGFRVVVGDINVQGALALARAITLDGGSAIGVECDVAEESSVESLLDTAERWGGATSVMVNNAGIARSGGILDGSLEDWHQVMRVNVDGTFHGVRSAGRRMAARGAGTIINLSSVAGFRASTVPQVAYDTSKAAIRMLTMTASVELGEHGVRVNAVAPGPVETDLMLRQLDTPGKKSSASAKSPFNRMGTAAEVAAAVSFLASDDASYISGHTLVVDGARLAR